MQGDRGAKGYKVSSPDALLSMLTQEELFIPFSFISSLRLILLLRETKVKEETMELMDAR